MTVARERKVKGKICVDRSGDHAVTRCVRPCLSLGSIARCAVGGEHDKALGVVAACGSDSCTGSLIVGIYALVVACVACPVLAAAWLVVYLKNELVAIVLEACADLLPDSSQLLGYLVLSRCA